MVLDDIFGKLEQGRSPMLIYKSERGGLLRGALLRQPRVAVIEQQAGNRDRYIFGHGNKTSCRKFGGRLTVAARNHIALEGQLAHCCKRACASPAVLGSLRRGLAFMPASMESLPRLPAQSPPNTR